MELKPGKHSKEEIEEALREKFGCKLEPIRGPLTDSNRQRCRKLFMDEERKANGWDIYQ